MVAIGKITAEEILDSRGIPTIKTTIYLDDASAGTASVPSGASVGTNEVLELRDGDSSRYGGKGVLKAVGNVQGPIFQAVRGLNSADQHKIDAIMRQLDGTENKSRLGANAILSVSLAAAVATSVSQKLPLYQYLRELLGPSEIGDFRLPGPMVNLINGGKHAKAGLDFQEFLLIPREQISFREIFDKISQVIEALRKIITEKDLSTNLGDEGGFVLPLPSNEEGITILKEAIRQAGFSKKDFGIGLDIAANTIYKDGFYHFRDFKAPLGSSQFVEYLAGLRQKHTLESLEDPLNEEDWSGWETLTKKLVPKVNVIADDLTATNPKRLSKLISQKAASGVVVKPNQIGTLTETLDFIKIAKAAGLKIVVSHRSGETEDTFIADLAVGLGADFIKIGSPLQKERVRKYERLVAIEEALGKEK